MKEPEAITMTPEEISQLRLALLGKAELNQEQRSILIGLLDNQLWLQFELQEAKISIHLLKSLFGMKSEKRSSAPDNTYVVSGVMRGRPPFELTFTESAKSEPVALAIIHQYLDRSFGTIGKHEDCT